MTGPTPRAHGAASPEPCLQAGTAAIDRAEPPARPLSRARAAAGALLGGMLCLGLGGPASAQQNGVMMQYFHWYLPADGTLWTQVKTQAPSLAAAGITALWLPPAYKGSSINDVGYGVYDHYDLGEFNVKGGIRTKYGTKDQYLQAVSAAKANGMQVYGDIVMNHLLGADATQTVTAVRVDENNRNIEYWGDIQIQAYTSFTYPARANKYSSFDWQWYHFDGTDYAANLGSDGCNGCRVYKFRGTGKAWDQYVSSERGNYDYLLGSDIDFEHPEVKTQMKNWGVWYTNFTGIDGYRIDAVKHISYQYLNEWLGHVRTTTGKTGAFAVGEYWTYDINVLNSWVNNTNGSGRNMTAFDAPLHNNFHTASRSGGNYDMRTIFNNTLVAWQPTKAVTLVDNHDTQPLQALESPVQDWFKPLAYAMILLRRDGYPTIFHADYYGASYTDRGINITLASHRTAIDQMLKARKFHSWGVQRDYFDHNNIVGWTREGDANHWYGVAVLMSDGPGGSKWMNAGYAHRNQCFTDITGNQTNQVCTNNDGWGTFTTAGGKVSVWVRTGKFGRNTN